MSSDLTANQIQTKIKCSFALILLYISRKPNKIRKKEEGMRSKFDACVEKISDEHVTIILNEVGENGVYTFSATEVKSAFVEYCEMNYKKQLEVSEEFIKSIVGMYHIDCNDPTRVSQCTSWNELVECVIPLLDKSHNDGLCGCD
ncbi:uncharacterized protein [Parasteatoda tepidariorum]|uniref:uncharacterized protein isoform X2 n=1 Tax=Parasteatoda tepidariorum TaxID=114398 RepID=UPI001C71E03A|nr:uncharacterized protein LOC107440276 isoform X2 [Parasteatoda tepidariorum]